MLKKFYKKELHSSRAAISCKNRQLFFKFDINLIVTDNYQLTTNNLKMQAEEIQEYCLKKKGVTESFPFNQETLVFKVGNKIFLLMSLESQPLKISLKNTPEKNIELRAEFWQIEGAYHMNKTHWSSVVCEGIKADLIKGLIDDSYNLVFKSLTKKMKDEVLAS